MVGAVLNGGWWTLGVAYAAVQVPMIAGLMRGRARFHQFLASPAVAVPLTVVAGIGMSLASPLLASLGAANNSLLEFGLGASLSAVLGYTGGRVVAETAPRNKTHQRGTVVTDRAAACPCTDTPFRAVVGDHIGRPCHTGAGRNEAFQTDRHDRNGQEYRHHAKC